MWLVAKYPARLLFRFACALSQAWTWLTAGAEASLDTCVSYIGSPLTRTSVSSKFPFVRRVLTQFRRGNVFKSCNTTLIRAYPVHGNGTYSSEGKFTMIHYTNIAPPLPKVSLPILSALLRDTALEKQVDVTNEMIRLAGPRHDFFGFSYPLWALIPWLCDRTNLIANDRDLILTICVDDTFDVYTYPYGSSIPRVCRNDLHQKSA